MRRKEGIAINLDYCIVLLELLSLILIVVVAVPDRYGVEHFGDLC